MKIAKDSRLHKTLDTLIVHGADHWITISVVILAIFGLLMISSASMGLAIDQARLYGNNTYLLKTVLKQVVFLGGGFFSMGALSRHFKLKLLSQRIFALLCFGMMGLLLSTLAFPAVNGSHAWITIPFPGIDLSIQPAEFAKIVVILIAAAYCGDVNPKAKLKGKIYRKPIFFCFAYLLIVEFAQHDFGSMVVIGMIFFVCMEIPSHPHLSKLQKYVGIVFLLLVVGGFYMLSPYGDSVIRKLPLEEYQKNRILSAINPFADRYGTGFQLISGLISFATGGWKGLGYGNSVRKYTSFPAANTDFILAIVVEELGLIGFALVFIPYMVIIIRLFKYAFQMRSERGKIILVGTAMYILLHSLFNIGGITGLIPLTGVPLLMISSGGSSTLSIMCCIGVAQAIISAYNTGELK